VWTTGGRPGKQSEGKKRWRKRIIEQQKEGEEEKKEEMM